MTDRWLEGRVVAITGAAGGLGRAVATLFSQHGAKLVLNDLGCSVDGVGHSEDPVNSLAESLRAEGAEVITHHGDVAIASEASALMQSAVTHFGGLDGLVCLAGIQRERTVLKMEEQDFDAVYRTVVKGSMLCAQAAGRVFAQQRRGGHIVLCTSIAGMFGNYGQVNGSAASAAVYGLTRTLAIELKKQSVRVNAIAPIARTRMTEGQPMFAAMPDETYGAHFVAPAVLFLCSSLCGELSGEVLSIAGTKLSTYRVVESEGALLDDPRTAWDPREIARRFDALSRL
ncbi:MAG: SDR family oxidoreductase [Deltaproteobacteria bacterium]|nr:SDR family oxidoreductase [Deltaproteobacteria bacterium]